MTPPASSVAYSATTTGCGFTHDRSAAMSSAEWSTAACLLANETNAAPGSQVGDARMVRRQSCRYRKG